MENAQQQDSPSRFIAGVMRWGKWGAGLEPAAQLNLINTCLENGINTFDLADIYGDYEDEGTFGQALALQPGLRERIRIITKCGIRKVSANRPGHALKSYDSGREHLLASVENSLRELQTDYLDALLIHRPDFLMDPAEVAATFQELKESGKVREFGVSNFSPSQFALLHDRFPLCTNQIEVSLTELSAFEDGRLDQALQLGIAPQAWSPLGGGSLFTGGGTEREARIRQVLAELSDKLGHRPDQLALAWLLSHPAQIRPILGSSRPERLMAAAQANKIKLSKEDWYALWTASTGKRVP